MEAVSEAAIFERLCKRMPREHASAIASRACVDANAPGMALAWLEASDLRLANGERCLRALLGKRCTMLNPRRFCAPHKPACADHVSLWLHNGRPAVYVSQPYHEPQPADFEFCAAHGLEMRASRDGGWHLPGRVWFVRIALPGTFAALPGL